MTPQYNDSPDLCSNQIFKIHFFLNNDQMSVIYYQKALIKCSKTQQAKTVHVVKDKIGSFTQMHSTPTPRHSYAAYINFLFSTFYFILFYHHFVYLYIIQLHLIIYSPHQLEAHNFHQETVLSSDPVSPIYNLKDNFKFSV